MVLLPGCDCCGVPEPEPCDTGSVLVKGTPTSYWTVPAGPLARQATITHTAAPGEGLYCMTVKVYDDADDTLLYSRSGGWTVSATFSVPASTTTLRLEVTNLGQRANGFESCPGSITPAVGPTTSISCPAPPCGVPIGKSQWFVHVTAGDYDHDYKSTSGSGTQAGCPVWGRWKWWWPGSAYDGVYELSLVTAQTEGSDYVERWAYEYPPTATLCFSTPPRIDVVVTWPPVGSCSVATTLTLPGIAERKFVAMNGDFTPERDCVDLNVCPNTSDSCYAKSSTDVIGARTVSGSASSAFTNAQLQSQQVMQTVNNYATTMCYNALCPSGLCFNFPSSLVSSTGTTSYTAYPEWVD